MKGLSNDGENGRGTDFNFTAKLICVYWDTFSAHLLIYLSIFVKFRSFPIVIQGPFCGLPDYLFCSSLWLQHNLIPKQPQSLTLSGLEDKFRKELSCTAELSANQSWPHHIVRRHYSLSLQPQIIITSKVSNVCHWVFGPFQKLSYSDVWSANL